MALKQKIEAVLEDNPAYGHKRIALHLGINKKRALRVMKLFNLSPKIKKAKKPVKKEDLKQDIAKVKNLTSDIDIDKPNIIWASDFTYLKYFNNKFIYLATIIDCFTREIIGWSLSSKHDADFIGTALYDALTKRNKPKILHSDQGSEYRSDKLSKILKSNKIKQSMSNKSSPWENGIQESFYGKFKLELGDPRNYKSLGELTEKIAHQIYYYNNSRIHTAIKTAPTIFYQQFQLQNR